MPNSLYFLVAPYIAIGSLFFPYSISVSKSKLPWRQYLWYLLLLVNFIRCYCVAFHLCYIALGNEMTCLFWLFSEAIAITFTHSHFPLYFIHSASLALLRQVFCLFFLLRVPYLLPNLAPCTVLSIWRIVFWHSVSHFISFICVLIVCFLVSMNYAREARCRFPSINCVIAQL